MKPPGSLKEHIGKLMLDYPAGIQLQELPILFKVTTLVVYCCLLRNYLLLMTK